MGQTPQQVFAPWLFFGRANSAAILRFFAMHCLSMDKHRPNALFYIKTGLQNALFCIFRGVSNALFCRKRPLPLPYFAGPGRRPCAAGRLGAARNVYVSVVRVPVSVVLSPGLVVPDSVLVIEYLQVFNLLLGKYSICFLPSIQCVACQVFINKPRGRHGQPPGRESAVRPRAAITGHSRPKAPPFGCRPGRKNVSLWRNPYYCCYGCS